MPPIHISEHLSDQKNSTATPAAKHMSRIEVRKLASIGFLPLEAMALKLDRKSVV